MESLRRVNRLVTVEPCVFLYYTGFAMGLVAWQETFYAKFCYQQHYSLTTCSNGTWEEVHPELQTKTSHWIIYTTLATIAPSMVCLTMLSSYSDRNSLNIALILPLVGGLVTTAWIIVQVVYLDWDPSLLLLSAVGWGVTGWYPAFTMATMTYITRDPDVSNRALRFSVLEGLMALATAVGTFVAGPIMDSHHGLVYVWILIGALNVLALLDILLRVKTLPKPTHHITSATITDNSTKYTTLKACFNMETFRSYFVAVFRKRENSKRLHLHIVFLSTMIGLLAFVGTSNITLLYLTKQYGMSLTAYSVYIGIACLVTLLGNTVLMYVFTAVYPLNDLTFGVIGGVGSAFCYALLGYADHIVLYWLSIVFRAFISYSAIGGRLYISHTMEPTEQAAGMGYYSTLQSIVGVLASIIFNSIYPLTLNSWPGLSFGIIAALYIVTVPLYTFVRWSDIRNGADTH